MKSCIILLIMLASAGLSWECPRCETGSTGEFCPSCSLPKPPESMAFVPACTVLLDGVEVEVDAFYIDSCPVTYREVLPWLEEVIESPEDLAAIITGQMDEHYQFLSFTPFINNEEGTALTVPAESFGVPAASFTWDGAALFLHDHGKQLPTREQIQAALEAGLVDGYDVYAAMLTYSRVLSASLGSLLGGMGNQSMFAGYSTASERIMWEWTRDHWGREPGEAVEMFHAYRTLFKPLDPPLLGAAGRDTGYFNVIFRGVVVLPMEWQ